MSVVSCGEPAVAGYAVQGYPSPPAGGLVDRWPRAFPQRGPKCGESAGANVPNTTNAMNVNFNNGNVNNNNKTNNNYVRCVRAGA